MIDPLPFVPYVRVSTEEQAAMGLSIDAQIGRVLAHARAHDLPVAEPVTDAGWSAGTLERPGIRRALAALDAGRAGGLLIARFDRLSRSVRDVASLLDGPFAPGSPHRLVSAGESLDHRTASGRMVLFLLAAVAQFEREATAERVGAVLVGKRGRGEALGHVPFGCRVAGDGKALEPCPVDRATLEAARSLHAAGWSTRRIAAELTRQGRPTKRGGPRWAHSTVAAILGRPNDPPVE